MSLTTRLRGDDFLAQADTYFNCVFSPAIIEEIMSYQQQQAPRRKGGGGLFFLILFGVGAFLIFSRMGNGPAGGNGAGQQQQPLPSDSVVDPIEDDYAAQREAVFGPDKPKSKIGTRMPSTGGTGAAAGWDIEDVATKKNSSETMIVPAPNSSRAKTQKGDWAIEEVDGEQKSGGDFKFSNQTSPPASDSGNNWAIQDIENPPTKTKTQKGDWSIEEN